MRDGSLLEPPHRHADTRVQNTVRLPDVTADAIALPDGNGPVRAIELIPGEIITRQRRITPAGRPGPDQLTALEMAVRALGVCLPAPFMSLSFLTLPVIPELKLTDQGLVHIGPDGLTPVELHVEEA